MLGTLPILPLPAPPEDGNPGPAPPAQLPPEDEKKEVEDQNKARKPSSVATHTRTVGIIYPPQDIRNIVDTTARFAAKNGPEFEKRIIANGKMKVKLNFLTASNPYHAYYQHRLSEFRSQYQSTEQLPSQTGEPSVSKATPAVSTDGSASTSEKTDPSAQFRHVRKVLEPPEAEQYTVRLPEGITGEELDIIKLTTQFVARNGKSFLTGLTSREMNNLQFHFLKPTHSMFMFFTALADAYSKVLMPPKGLTEKLKKSVADRTTVLEQCLHRLEWEKSLEQARQKVEDELEQERIQMAMIDWHDFVVVEIIDFADDEDEALPMPMTLQEVLKRSKISAKDKEIVEPGMEVEMEMDEEEMQLVQEGMKAAILEEDGEDTSEVKAAMDEDEPPMRIVKNWKRPEERMPAERDPTKFMVSPITGELIPIGEMSEHMRISLIDPKYKEQKERMFAKIRKTTLAHDDEISRNIVGLARTRPDIFGSTEEEVTNAVKAEIETKKDEQPKQVIWDGHSGSVGRAANQAMSRSMGGGEKNQESSNALPGPAAAPPPRPVVSMLRPLPPPANLAVNMPQVPGSNIQYSAPTSGMMAPPPPRPLVPSSQMIPPPPPPMQMALGQQHMMMNQPPIPLPGSMNQHSIPVPYVPVSQFTPLGVHRPFAPVPPDGMPPAPPLYMPQGMPPPPPPPEEEARPPLPEEPEPKRLKLDDAPLIPEEQFLAQHPGLVRINISVPHTDEGNLKGQVLEITVSLTETVGSLKEKISGEIQLPANKQKLSGKAGFLKDNLKLAYYNIGDAETLTLSLRERGGRKR